MEIEFRLCPVKELMLGEGRHSDVYLGAYRVKEEVKNPSFEVDEDEDHEWRLCAMKRPHADRQSQLLALEEAFALRRLGPHPNIIRLIKIRDEIDGGAGVLRQAETDTSRNDAPRLLMLLELLPFSLSSFSRRNPELVDYKQWRTWALELAGVVEWMHSRGCIHADLKPENILLTSDLHVKLCDFNSALFPNASTPLMDGIGLGTPAYGAPELSRSLNKSSDSSKGFSYPVDIWSLGAILYTLATGTEPFRRARSMIDMVYRKRVFFESEENDRVARMSVAEGSSTAGPASYYSGTIAGNQGSLPTSRKSSIRGRKSDGSGMANTSTSTPLRSQAYSMHKRAPSTESVSSINKTQMERTTSRESLSSLNGESPRVSISPPSSLSRKTGENAELRLAVAAAFARSTNYAPPSNSTTSKNTTIKDLRKMSGDMSSFSLQDRSQSHTGYGHEQESYEEQEDLRAYHDGTPALLLPGGGRLPDQARNLLERMLRTDPAQRPTASQVRAVLESL
ncbi:kinase-like protein [Meira miltonrushii]|uniref:Kinase-like protein n=1 Tax=Meira miltonrushii TaxID=1280837 RepID=A0A316V668_9BASI|nr:kinase-like protein [Meira miltonrushii]PWN33089.1 kinase-like protein [Meira miltonrushii]